MTHYLINFSIYTLAMVGVIFAALFVFKSAMTGKAFSKKTSSLKVEDSMNLSPRKTIYVINAGGQRFLVASDVDRTTLISKLDDNSTIDITKVRQDKSNEFASTDGIESLDEFSSVIDFKRESRSKGPFMKELARKLEF